MESMCPLKLKGAGATHPERNTEPFSSGRPLKDLSDDTHAT